VPGPPVETAAVRLAVRRCLTDVPAGAPVAAAVSGGSDSLALAAALAKTRPGSLALVVDHALQAGSRAVAERAAEQCAGLGLSSHVLIPSAGAGGPESGGPENRARRLRYAALSSAVRQHCLAAVLLGHTRDDQAETVLLALARGSGARSLAGMAAVRGPYRRPLLALERSTTRRACAQAGLSAWDDPHNDDPAFARVRVRTAALPALEAALGPGIAAALARSAEQLREDADALDARTPDLPVEPACAAVLALIPALRTRALKRWAEREAGVALSSAHVRSLRALVEDWRGQGPTWLPAGARVERRDGRLACRRDLG